MGKLIKFIVKLIVFVVIITVLVFAAARLPLGPVSNVAKTAEAELMQIFDSNALTKRAAQELVDAENKALAKAMDITEAQAASLLKEIDIAGWTTTELPENVYVSKVIENGIFGKDTSLILYSNKSYIGIQTGDNLVVLSVPEGAQQAVSYLYFL